MRFGRSEGGFTLIELAIVLVIIGIILGAVMKAQDLVANAKAKKLASRFQACEVYVWSYYDRHNEFPSSDNVTSYLKARYGSASVSLGDIKCGFEKVNGTDICWWCNGTKKAKSFYFDQLKNILGMVSSNSTESDGNGTFCYKFNSGNETTTYY